jgi:glycosyltransferase involved in cell wall biosynthesis
MSATGGNKKLLVITYYWPPSGGAGVQRILKFCKYLPSFNVSPYVISVDEKIASYPVTDQSLINDVPNTVLVHKTKSFEPLTIISRLFGKDKIPHAGFANHKKEKLSSKILRFIRGNFFIPDARKGWVKYAFAKACELIEKEKIKTVLISSPPHSSQLVGIKLKKKYPHINWIADMRDPWTDIYYYKDLMHTKSSARKDATFEKEVLTRADKVIVVSDDIKRLFSEKISDSSKIIVLPNGYDEEDFINKNEKKTESDFTITYTGTIAETYKTAIFFEAVAEFLKITTKKIKLQFVGSTSSAIKKEIEQLNLSRVTTYIPYVKHADAINYMLNADALLLVIPDVANSNGILTGKLFEYLAAQKPIITIGPKNGDAAKMINYCEAGKVFERNEKEILLGYLIYLTENKYNSSGNTNFKNYSRQKLTGELAKHIY